MDSVDVCLAILGEDGAFRMFPLVVLVIIEDGVAAAALKGKLLLAGVFAVARESDADVRLLSERYAALQFDAEGFLLPKHLER